MIFSAGYGILIWITFLHRFIHPRLKSRNPKIKIPKLVLLKKIALQQLIPELENTVFRTEEQPYSSLFQLYKNEFLDTSVSKRLIHLSLLH